MSIQFIFAFITYFTLLFSIATYFHKKNSSSGELLLGSRSMNFWVTALSAHASDMSSWIFMAFPMSIFISGLPNIWIAISLLIGMFATWQFVAPKLRTMTEQYNSYTLPSFFSESFHKSSALRAVSMLSIVVFMSYYLAAGLISIGFLFESIFHMDYTLGVLLAMAVMMSYVFIGGFVSVAWADLFQAIFLLIALGIVPTIMIFSFEGGFSTIAQAAAAQNIPLTFFNTNSSSQITDVINTSLGWGLGYFGMPHIIIKFMGIKNVRDMKKSQYIGISWQMVALFFAALFGLASIPFFQNSGIANPELIFVEAVQKIIPGYFSGLILCGVLAATISTMDSQLLTVASTITEDFYKVLYTKEHITDKREVFVFRLSVVLISILAFCTALSRDRTIMDTVYFAWSGLGASFGPLLLVTLYSKKRNTNAAIIGVMIGALVSIFWPECNKILVEKGFLTSSIPSLGPAFFLSLFSILLLNKQPSHVQVKIGVGKKS